MSLAPPEADPSVPPFVPPTALVEAHSRALVGDAYDDMSPLERFHLGQKSLDVLGGLGETLVGAALDHVTTHASAFGFNESLASELMFARMAGSIASLPSTDDDVPGPPD